MCSARLQEKIDQNIFCKKKKKGKWPEILTQAKYVYAETHGVLCRDACFVTTDERPRRSEGHGDLGTLLS